MAIRYSNEASFFIPVPLVTNVFLTNFCLHGPNIYIRAIQPFPISLTYLCYPYRYCMFQKIDHLFVLPLFCWLCGCINVSLIIKQAFPKEVQFFE